MNFASKPENASVCLCVDFDLSIHIYLSLNVCVCVCVMLGSDLGSAQHNSHLICRSALEQETVGNSRTGGFSSVCEQVFRLKTALR